MNVMYYGMVNGYHTYYPSSAVASVGGTGLLSTGTRHNGATSALPTATGTALAGATGTASMVPKWVMPGFSATQIQYMFRHRMDKGAKVNKAVKCETCGITLNSEQQAKQHYSGKNHLKKLRGIGKKKEGKDGEDSDKESEHRKFRDRKNRRREKAVGGDSSKPDEKDQTTSEVKADKENNQSENRKLELSISGQHNADNANENTINGNQTDVADKNNDCTQSSDNCEMLKTDGPEFVSSCEDADLIGFQSSNPECKSSSQNESQNQEGDSIKCDAQSALNDSDFLSCPSDDVGFTASNCDKITNKLRSVPRSPPNGVEVSSCQFTPASNLDSSAVSSSSSNSSIQSSCNNKSFKLPNGAVCNPVITKCTNDADNVKNGGSSALSSTSTSTVTSSSSSQPSPLLKRPHSPTTSSSVHSSCSRSTTVGVIPQKKARGGSYTSARALATSVEVRASMISAPHLALTPNSIPGFAALQAPVPPTKSQMALLRPILPAHASTSLPSQVPSYGAQYSSVKSYPGALAQSAVGSYPVQYQALSPSDVSSLHPLRPSLQQSLLTPYYPTTLTSPHIQQPMLTQTGAEPLAISPDLLTTNHEVLTSDLTSYLQSSKDILGQPVSVNYANAASTSTGLPPGYQYQALSMQAFTSVPKTASTPSPPYLSFSAPKNISAIPTIPVASAMNPTPMMTTASDGQRQVAFGQGRSNDSSKLDPVSQAVYDNVLGKLPLKRKKEIPCTTCGLVFNSDAQASAHFAGSKHQKRQKATEDGEQVESKTHLLNSEGDETKGVVRIPCDVCGLVFSNEEQAEVHFRGMKHNKRLKLEQTKKEGLPSGVAVKDWGTPFSCTLCKTTLNSAEQLEQHLQGKQHRLRQAQQSGYTGTTPPPNQIVSNTWTEVPGREPGWFYCQTCDISVRTGMCLQRHVQGQKHKENTAAKR